MKHTPLLFKTDMVRAMLDGRKTMTRRIIKPQPLNNKVKANCLIVDNKLSAMWREGYGNRVAPCPYGKPGDLLWCKETWENGNIPDDPPMIHYKADDPDLAVKWKLARYMFKKYSRLTLKITDIRVERLQDISEEDAKAEGLFTREGDGGKPGWGYKWKGTGYHGAGYGDFGITFHVADNQGVCECNVGWKSPAQCAFRELWDSINGKTYPWSSNPWVWCISFRTIKGNVLEVLNDGEN